MAKIKTGLKAIACIVSIFVLAACQSAGNGAGAPSQQAKDLLTRLYTVEEYLAPPKSEEDVEKMADVYKDCVNEETLETLMANRVPTRISDYAEENGAYFTVKDIAFEQMPDDENYYRYTVTVQAETDGGAKELEFTGKVIVDEAGVVTLFSQDAYPEFPQ